MPEEIADCVQFLGSEKAIAKLIHRAMDAGVVFSPKDLLEMECVLDEDLLCHLIDVSLSTGNHFTPEEIDDVSGLIDEDVLSRIVIDAVEHGVIFTTEQVIELNGLIDEDTLALAAKTVKGTFRAEQLQELEGRIDEEVLLELDKKAGTGLFHEAIEDDFDDEPEYDELSDDKAPSGFFGRLAMAFGIGVGISQGIKDATENRPRRFRVGDHVRVRYRGQEGTVVDINGSLYIVSLNDGGYVDSYYEDQIERAW